MKKIEFSKIILIVMLLLAIISTGVGIWLAITQVATELLLTIIGSIFVELSCATATYYWKTKSENRIKITIGAIKEILELGELDETKTRIIEALINTLG